MTKKKPPRKKAPQHVIQEMIFPEITLRYRDVKEMQGFSRVNNTEQAAKLMRSLFQSDELNVQEVFVVAFLNRGGRVTGYYRHTKGTTNAVMVDFKLILTVAVRANASAILVAHNHPGGNPLPSAADTKVTQNILNGLTHFSIELLDHFIITEEGFYSFRERSNLWQYNPLDFREPENYLKEAAADFSAARSLAVQVSVAVDLVGHYLEEQGKELTHENIARLVKGTGKAELMRQFKPEMPGHIQVLERVLELMAAGERNRKEIYTRINAGAPLSGPASAPAYDRLNIYQKAFLWLAYEHFKAENIPSQRVQRPEFRALLGSDGIAWAWSGYFHAFDAREYASANLLKKNGSIDSVTISKEQLEQKIGPFLVELPTPTRPKIPEKYLKPYYTITRKTKLRRQIVFRELLLGKLTITRIRDNRGDGYDLFDAPVPKDERETFTLHESPDFFEELFSMFSSSYNRIRAGEGVISMDQYQFRYLKTDPRRDMPSPPTAPGPQPETDFVAIRKAIDRQIAEHPDILNIERMLRDNGQAQSELYAQTQRDEEWDNQLDTLIWKRNFLNRKLNESRARIRKNLEAELLPDVEQLPGPEIDLEQLRREVEQRGKTRDWHPDNQAPDIAPPPPIETPAIPEKPTKMPQTTELVQQREESVELKIIRSFLRLDRKKLPQRRSLNLLKRLQREIRRGNIRRGKAAGTSPTPYHKEMDWIQKMLVKGINQGFSTADPLEERQLNFPPDKIKELTALVNQNKVYTSVKIALRYIGMARKPTTKAAVRRFLTYIDNREQAGEIGAGDPAADQVPKIKKELEAFLKGNSEYLRPRGQTLEGLGNILGRASVPDALPATGGEFLVPPPRGAQPVLRRSTRPRAGQGQQRLEFSGRWRELFNQPGRGFTVLLWGKAKSGKSTLALGFAHYLASNFGPTLYASLEEDPEGATFADRERRLGARHDDLYSINHLPADLSAFDFVFIDSVSWGKMGTELVKELIEQWPQKTFVFIAHATNDGLPRGGMVYQHLVDVLVSVEKGQATADGRYGPGAAAVQFEATPRP